MWAARIRVMGLKIQISGRLPIWTHSFSALAWLSDLRALSETKCAAQIRKPTHQLSLVNPCSRQNLKDVENPNGLSSREFRHYLPVDAVSDFPDVLRQQKPKS